MPTRQLLDEASDVMPTKHCTYSTEKNYVQWIRHYILFHNKRYSHDIAKPEVRAFLTLDTIMTVHSRSTYDTLTVSSHSTH